MTTIGSTDVDADVPTAAHDPSSTDAPESEEATTDDDLDQVVHATEATVDDDDDEHYYHIDTQREETSPASSCEDLSLGASQAQVRTGVSVVVMYIDKLR